MAYSNTEDYLNSPNLEEHLNQGINHPDLNYNSASRDFPRSKRKFVTDDSKDCYYWQKRSKNKDAARKSRWKRRSLETYMEKRLALLVQENQRLRLELKELRIADVCVGKPITNGQSEQNLHSGEPTQLKQIITEETNKSLKSKSDLGIPLKFRHKNQVHSVFNREG